MKLVDFLMTNLFQLAEYVCGLSSLPSSEPAATNPQETIPTIRFSDQDRMVEGELFNNM